MAASSSGGDEDRAGTDGDIGRRRLVKLLVGLAFGVPLLVEGLTFLGLVENWTAGEGQPEPATTRPPEPSTTPTPEPVGDGEELLPETPQTDRLTELRVADGEGGREVTLVVAVANDGDSSYRLRLSRLTTAAGDRIQGGGRTDTLSPGESTTLTARWTVPADARPTAVETVATTGSAVVRRVVPLAVD